MHDEDGLVLERERRDNMLRSPQLSIFLSTTMSIDALLMPNFRKIDIRFGPPAAHRAMTSVRPYSAAK